jgi:hypothetical protein
MTLRLNGSTSGYTEIDSPAVGGNNNLTLPTTANGSLVALDSSGRLGIGLANPITNLDVFSTSNTQIRAATNNSSSIAGLLLEQTGTGASSFIVRAGSNYTVLGTSTNTPILFTSNNLERMRLDPNGRLLVGTSTAVGSGTIECVASNAKIVIRSSGATAGKSWGLSVDDNNSFILYNNGGSGVWIGDGGTTWNSSSDERLKDITGGFPNASDSVDQLRAVRFTWKSEEGKTPRVGLIAQDVEKVVPEAVAVDPNGFKSVAYTDLIPLLTAALQEANAKIKSQGASIATLEARLTALEVTP